MAENQYYLTTRWSEEMGQYMAVITKGHKRTGDKKITVCDVDIFATKDQAHKWFKEQLETKPWEQSSI